MRVVCGHGSQWCINDGKRYGEGLEEPLGRQRWSDPAPLSSEDRRCHCDAVARPVLRNREGERLKSAVAPPCRPWDGWRCTSLLWSEMTCRETGRSRVSSLSCLSLWVVGGGRSSAISVLREGEGWSEEGGTEHHCLGLASCGLCQIGTSQGMRRSSRRTR